MHLQVIELKKKKRYLLQVTEAGGPVASPVLANVLGIKVKDDDEGEVFDVTADATATVLAPGLLIVALDLPKAAKKARIFQFTVVDSHSDPELGNFGHVGSSIIDTGGKDDD